MKSSLVSVIITTKNEEDVIGKLLLSIKRQVHKNIEVIVVDNYSTDKTKLIAQKFKVKIFDYGPERSAQRNFGAKKAKGNYLLFLDADMKLTTRVTEESLKKIRISSDIGGVVIPEKSVASNFWEKVKAFERSFYNEFGDEVTDAARFFPKRIFLKVGGYDEGITGAEDWDLPETIRKAGYKIERINRLIYHKERIPSVFFIAKKKFYYGLKAHRYLSKQKISIISPKTIYFLRASFYKKWRKLLANPVLSLGMLVMLSFELIGGSLGYLVGRIRKT